MSTSMLDMFPNLFVVPGTIFDLSSVANCSRVMLWIYKNCGKKKTFVSRKAGGLMSSQTYCGAKPNFVSSHTSCQEIRQG